MSAAHSSKTWIYILITGVVVVLATMFLGQVLPHWLAAILLGVGGLAVVFGSSESMIMSVEGYAKKAQMNSFVAGTMGGLASNIPELVMLAFVLAAAPRVGFIVTILTLHVGAIVFGLYCGFLPRDLEGQAKMPKPLVSLSTDMYAAAAGVFFSLGILMIMMRVLPVEGKVQLAFSATDLYVVGIILLIVQTVAVHQLVKRFSGKNVEEADLENTNTKKEQEEDKIQEKLKDDKHDSMSTGMIVFYGCLGIVASVLGGHAVGDFAGILVHSLEEAGYSQMLGALILSIFAAMGGFVLIAMAHLKGNYDIAMANASGLISQVPFLVMPIAMILLAVFAQTGVVPLLEGGGVLSIDFETTSVMLLAFPPMLILWKAVQDDGKVNWLETTSMIAIASLVVYLLVMHG